MEIKVNGERRPLPAETSVAELLQALGYQPAFIAVAVNRTCVKRSDYAATLVGDKDEIEILSPMAGG